MAKYQTVSRFKGEGFRRLTGVKKETFEKMMEILREAEKKHKARGGKPNKLSLEDRLLMTSVLDKKFLHETNPSVFKHIKHFSSSRNSTGNLLLKIA